MKRIEINKKYKGYEYLVYAQPMGHRCGYVKIPKGHYLYGKSYSEQLNIKRKQIDKEPIGKRGIIDIFCSLNLKEEDNISMSLLFDVHGGITFSGKFNRKHISKSGWWIGFDCAHCDDKSDYSIMDKKRKEMEDKYKIFDGGTIRDKEYVEKECKNLIDQIIKWFK